MAQDPKQHFHTLLLNFPCPDNVFIDPCGDEYFDENDPFTVAWRNSPVPGPQRTIQNIPGITFIDISRPMGADCPICAMLAASMAGAAGHEGLAAQGGYGVVPQAAQGEDAGVPDTASQGGYGAYGDDYQHGTPHGGI